MTTRIQSAADMALAFGGPFAEMQPTLLDSSYSESEGQTYGANNGGYSFRVGNIIFISGDLELTSLGTLTTTDVAYLGGLPYTAIGKFALNIGFTDGCNLGGTYTVQLYTQGATPRCVFRLSDANDGGSNLLISEFSATGRVFFSGWYITDDPF